MWRRIELKAQAKINLKETYWQAIVVVFVLILLGAAFGATNYVKWINTTFRIVEETLIERGTIDSPAYDVRPEMSEYSGFTRVFTAWVYMGLLSGVGIYSFFYRPLLGYPLAVGGIRFFLSSSFGQGDLRHFISIFRSRKYWKVVWTMLVRSVLIILWTLVFIVPGIIKRFEYAMVVYILADNPAMPTRQALALSKRMMNGHKVDAWFLSWSFIGWYALAMLTCGVGLLFVAPYEQQTQTQLYIRLRDIIIAKGEDPTVFNLPSTYQSPFAPQPHTEPNMIL